MGLNSAFKRLRLKQWISLVKMVKQNLHALYSGLTKVHTLTVLCTCEQQVGIRASLSQEMGTSLHIASRMCMWGHTVVQTKSFFL